ncbi:MAG: translation initiation factor IF-2 [Patescibacteria group bacterium]
MNVSELARRLKITTNQLHEVLPQMGIDVGRKAVKIDDRTANRVLRTWSHYQHLLIKDKEEEQATPVVQEKKRVTLPPVITVRDFAALLNIPVTKLITVLMNNGILAALNERIDFDTAAIISEDLGCIVEPQKETDYTEETLALNPLKDILDREPTLIPRPPVVVIIGHVDHGKTSLLDKIRTTNVVSGEAGGITQHIGAYQVKKKKKDTGEEKRITFIDTPGHEAFTTMRSRGAKVADIAILVVAADDGVKPQTIESIKIIKAAGLPIIVAINKIDKPDADIERVKRELADNGLIPEDWSGTTICVPVSAKKGTGIEDLLDMILLVADMEKSTIVANPSGTTVATVIESHIDRNEGPLATLLVQNGTLCQNDYILHDNTLYGKARALRDWNGSPVASVEPSMPVKIVGLKTAPLIGDMLYAAKKLDKSVEKNLKYERASAAIIVTPRRTEGEKEHAKAVKFILKTDTLGSLEAIGGAMLKIDHPEVKVKIIAKDLGNVTTADVLSAEGTGGFIAGFHVAVNQSAAEIAREKNVEIKLYKIIYELIDDIRSRVEALITPDVNRIILGTLKVVKIFRSEPKTTILGGRVEEGIFEKGARVMVMRGEDKITEGKIGLVKSGKTDVPSAQSGQECGIQFDGKSLIKEGDVLKAYREEKIQGTLEA